MIFILNFKSKDGQIFQFKTNKITEEEAIKAAKEKLIQLNYNRFEYKLEKVAKKEATED